MAEFESSRIGTLTPFPISKANGNGYADLPDVSRWDERPFASEGVSEDGLFSVRPLGGSWHFAGQPQSAAYFTNRPFSGVKIDYVVQTPTVYISH